MVTYIYQGFLFVDKYLLIYTHAYLNRVGDDFDGEDGGGGDRRRHSGSLAVQTGTVSGGAMCRRQT